MIFKSRALVASIALCAVFGVCANASAATAWTQHHPRRAKVNHRLAIQGARIRDEVHDCDLTKGQAQTLRSEDRTIRQQERFDASLNNMNANDEADAGRRPLRPAIYFWRMREARKSANALYSQG